MKDLNLYISEAIKITSKSKVVMDEDIKSNISKIEFDVDIDKYYNDEYLRITKSIFEKLPQHVINTIKEVSIVSSGMWGSYSLAIYIDGVQYFVEFKKDYDGYLYVTNTNVKGIDEDEQVGHSNEDRPYASSLILLLKTIYKKYLKK